MEVNDVDLVRECAESLRAIRALKAGEPDPTVTRELDTVIRKLDEFSEANPGEKLPEGLIRRVMKVLAKVALAIPWIQKIFGCLNE